MMKPRLLILLAVAVLLVVLVLVKQPWTPAVVEDDGTELASDDTQDIERIRELQKTLSERTLPGEEPDEEPELSVQVEVNTSGGKNRLDFYLSEAHGYYVETFKIEFWYKPNADTDPEDSPYKFEHYLNDFIEAGKTKKDCIEVVPAELSVVGGEIGTSENWGARVVSYNRARAENPDPLPVLTNMRRCD